MLWHDIPVTVVNNLAFSRLTNMQKAGRIRLFMRIFVGIKQMSMKLFSRNKEGQMPYGAPDRALDMISGGLTAVVAVLSVFFVPDKQAALLYVIFFGYYPIFLMPELVKTAAELTAEEKNAISHRGLAMVKLIDEMKKRWAL